MDFQQFGIDARLLDAPFIFRSRAFSHETILSHVLGKGENVLTRIVMSQGREEVILLPVLQSLVSAGSELPAKALVVVAEAEMGRFALEFCRAGGERLGLRACLVSLRREAEAVSLSWDGEASAEFLIGEADAVLVGAENGEINLRNFGWLVVDGLERLAELPDEPLRRLGSSLRAPWERRSILACQKLTTKAKNLAYDLADNPSEIRIDEEVAKAQSVVKETWRIEGSEKMRFLLGLVERERPRRICVFCNLAGTAEEISRKLQANGVASAYVTGDSAVDPAERIFERPEVRSTQTLVLTDEGAQRLDERGFSILVPLIVNYDIPLEPEYFVKRLELLDRGDESAKVVSLVCDRYVYGLTAVEQYIETKLEARPIDPRLLAARDLVESNEADRVRDPGRGGRAKPNGPRGGGSGSGKSGLSERERAQPQARRSHFSTQRDDRSPDIRRSIAEATGGALDMGTGMHPDANSGQKPSAGHTGKSGNLGRKLHPDTRRQSEPKPKHSRTPHGGGNFVGRPGPGLPKPGTSSPNPYELSMEERMRRYREKYGRKIKNFDRESSEASRDQDRRNSGGRHGGGEKHPSPRFGSTHGQNIARDEAGSDAGPPSGENRVSRDNPPGQPQTGASSSNLGGETRPEESTGFFGRLKGAFRKSAD